ncbi:hypothetical protein ACYOEI_29435 [Singulisphaera rosea]
MHPADQLSLGRVVHAHYCPMCQYAKKRIVTLDESHYPKFLFTLKQFMVVVAIFAIPNGLLAWVMRGGILPKPKDPELARQLILSAFLATNLCFSLVVIHVVLAAWLRKMIWYKRTGGIIPYTKRTSQEVSSARNIFVMSFNFVFMSNMITSFVLGGFRIGRSREDEVFVAVAVLLGLAALAVTRVSPAARAWLRAFCDEWRCASAAGRILKILAFSTLFLVKINIDEILAVMTRLGRISPWLVLPALLLAILGYRTMFMACEASLTRRA